MIKVTLAQTRPDWGYEDKLVGQCEDWDKAWEIAKLAMEVFPSIDVKVEMTASNKENNEEVEA